MFPVVDLVFFLSEVILINVGFSFYKIIKLKYYSIINNFHQTNAAVKKSCLPSADRVILDVPGQTIFECFFATQFFFDYKNRGK